MKKSNFKTMKLGFFLKATVLAILIANITGCVSSVNRQAVSDSVMVPQFAMVISSEEASFMMGPNKNGAVYCFEKGMRMELRGYKEEGKIFINPGSIGTHELQHILNCIDPEKYGEPDGYTQLATTERNGVKMIAKRGNY